MLRGLALLAVGKKDEARAALSLALTVDAALQFDTSRTPPAALALLEQARAALPSGSLTVSSTGSGVTLRIDGVDFGRLPLTTRIPIGRAIAVATLRPGVSFFVISQGGGGLTHGGALRASPSCTALARADRQPRALRVGGRRGRWSPSVPR
ncbi:MAG: hypothetical protein INH41_00805 [Myxococcaceae bacterium]|nr:hypothetical protein [Myxococcaceae bacterium]MCA3010917.1 hypothetical protein [Myxococcaceae bacterium]